MQSIFFLIMLHCKIRKLTNFAAYLIGKRKIFA